MIDKNAFVHPTAKIAEGVSIGPWSYIDEQVTIGAGTIIEPHVVIKKNTVIGTHNHIYQFASIGEAPQHTAYQDEPTQVVIGNHNKIREYVSINRATAEADGVTRIGDHNFLMSYAHVAHDCVVGNHIVFANNASLAGHVVVDDHVILGGFTGVHQFCRIGAYSFLGRATKIVQDIMPYTIVSGNPGQPTAVNSIGLRRHQFSREDIRAIKQAFTYIFRASCTQEQAITYLQTHVAQHACLQAMLDLMQVSERGIARASKES